MDWQIQLPTTQGEWLTPLNSLKQLECIYFSTIQFIFSSLTALMAGFLFDTDSFIINESYVIRHMTYYIHMTYDIIHVFWI